MINSVNFLGKNVHIVYNNSGKSFKELLEEGIQQVSLQTIQKQIITNITPNTRRDCE